jgi:hypothetical protein
MNLEKSRKVSMSRVVLRKKRKQARSLVRSSHMQDLEGKHMAFVHLADLQHSVVLVYLVNLGSENLEYTCALVVHDHQIRDCSKCRGFQVQGAFRW